MENIESRPSASFLWQDVVNGLHEEAHKRVVAKQMCNAEHLVNEAKVARLATKSVRNKYPLGADFPGIRLAEREAECVYLLLQNKRYKQIGSEMNISLRTVETYIKNIRAKLRCNKKAEIIEIIKRSAFLMYYQKKVG